MANQNSGGDFGKLADSLLDNSKIQKISSKQSDIEKLANSAEGKKVSELVDKKSLVQAIEKGDASVMQNAIKNIMKTEEGARLVQQINEMMK